VALIRRPLLITLALTCAAAVCVAAQYSTSTSPEPVATFSILGFDPATGEVGGAVNARPFRRQ
jgi:hypothetical protein